MAQATRRYNDVYQGDHLNYVAFPLGGIGAGMFCLEGTGAFSHFSLRNKPNIFSEPCVFSALCVTGGENIARVLEGQVPMWKVFGTPGSGNGLGDRTYGLPRFAAASFTTRFPFGTVRLEDGKVPLTVELTGWSPFIPNDADNSSLPVAAVEYRFTNPTGQPVEAVYSFNAKNFMATGREGQAVLLTPGGFILSQTGSEEKPFEQGAFCAVVEDKETYVNCAWFRGGWWDALTLAWKDVSTGAPYEKGPIAEGQPSPGGTIFVPFKLPPGEEKMIRLLLSWYVSKSDLCMGSKPEVGLEEEQAYQPWYTGKFASINEVAGYWQESYQTLRAASETFSKCFYDTTLPEEVVEAVAANLTILKSPTVLRQADGRLWCWEGCGDQAGCCHGSCTHVWNYAQALCNLFPDLERSLRQTEFGESQDEKGHQSFRSVLPIGPCGHEFHAASDGQLGGIMKVYREWRISGNGEWMRSLWPKVKASLDYCIATWDPDHQGVVLEPHHNTYDIEFWGADGMCSSFYLGALAAAIEMGRTVGEGCALYRELLEKGKTYLETRLFNGEYFYQKIQWEGLHALNPLLTRSLVGDQYSPEAAELLEREGPKYQYGNGCLSDGVLGAWMAKTYGLGEILDEEKIKSHLRSVHRYNLKRDLSEHANPQRPGYALGKEGGLLLCSWPHGGKLTLPFVYSDEVWTGIEYQVASHLMMEGMVEEGLEIVRICRDRYDGRVRNPFNEYECGHWYARAMSSYALLQGVTGARYDAVEKVVYLNPSLKGDFHSFLCTATGYGTVGVRNGRPFVEVKQGEIEIKEIRST